MSLAIPSDATTSAAPGGLSIRAFEGTAADYAAVVALNNICFPENPDSVEEWRHWDSTRTARIKHQRWIAELNGEAVGFGEYGQSESMYHPQKFRLSLAVHPAHQGRGIGRALYGHILAALAPHDPISLRAEVRADMARAVRFVTERGFVEDMRFWESYLELASFDPAPFAGAEERALASGITITTVAELQARDPYYRRKLYELDQAATADEPHPEPITPVPQATYEAWVFDDPNYLPEANFIALDGDRYIGMSTLGANQGDPTELHVGFTGVLREYRGRGIALALKLRTIDYARRRGFRRLVTSNASINRPMLRINEALGFVKRPVWISYRKLIKQE